MPKTTQLDRNNMVWTNKEILKELLVENLESLNVVCTVLIRIQCG